MSRREWVSCWSVGHQQYILYKSVLNLFDTSVSTWIKAEQLGIKIKKNIRNLRSTSQRCKANRNFCFASSQVWSEHKMLTTSWDPCPAASPRERTSQHPPVTSRTSSTRARGTPGQSREVVTLGCFRRDPQIQLITNRTLSPRDPQTHRRTPPPTPTQLTKSSTSVTATRRSIMTVAITATAIATTVTTDTGRSRGSTSAGDGRNVCKGNFSF